MRPFVLVSLALVACTQQPPSCPVPDRWQDAGETPEESASGDACHRAGVRIKVVCPSMWRADWDAWCHAEVDNGVPLCPSKLARVHSCEEANRVCR